MKKHFVKLFMPLLFLITTAMTCDDGPITETKDILYALKEVELYHWNNAGESPKEPIESKVPKEAYILEIRLLAEVEKDSAKLDTDEYYYRHILSDPIKKIQIFTETTFNGTYSQGSDVTSCFFNYPLYIDKYQCTDYTAQGGSISYVDETNRIYKALMIIPQPGEYRFRIVLTKESGETVERVSDPVSLY